jgi:uncharacterized protein YwqG
MRLLLQLDMSILPAKCDSPLRKGLLQLFYCSRDDGSCETWQPFSGAQAIIVSPDTGVETSAPDGGAPFEKAFITDWEEFEDTPHPEEHEPLGIHYDYDFRAGLVDVTCSNPATRLTRLSTELDVAELISNARTGDKLGGWPHWIQSAEYPSCPDCKSPMQLLMQIDSEDNLPYMFGDTGCAHLTQCRKHPQTFAFGWACS